MQKSSFYDILLESFPPLAFIVEGLLPAGLFVLAGSPKVGKSLFVLDLCLSVALGLPFLGFPTTKSTVIYFAFEDNLRSLKERAIKQSLDIFTKNDKLFIIQDPIGLHSGLIEQIHRLMRKFPDTRLIVIDVFEYIRDSKDAKLLLYQSDMRDMKILRQLTFHYPELTILLVHHTTKLVDQNNVMNQVSGSTGLTGGTDGIFVLHKRQITDKQATLTCIMREIESVEYQLELDVGSLRWGRIDGEAGKLQKYSKPTIAEVFLEHVLADGAVSSREVKEKATWLGITERQLKYVKKKLGVQTIQKGAREDTQTFWKL